MANINKIRISGTSYDIQDLNAIKVVDITQAAYDALPASAKTANILYNITDAEAADLSQYWTSAQTQSAITEATSGCTVNETVIYVSWGDNYRDTKSEQESVRLRNAILNYLGDKTTATSVNLQVQTYNINTQNWYYPYITLDYVNGTYTKLQDDNNTITVEYDSTIEDFKLSVPSTQPNVYIRGIYFYGGEVLVPTATIESGSTSDVIEGSIANLIGDLYSKDLKSVKNTTLMTNSPKELSFAFFRKDGTSESTLLKLDDLKVDTRGSQTLKTDINIPLGTSGWTNVDISQSNCSTDYLGEPLPFLSFRITCNSNNMDYLALYIKAGYINYYTNFYIRWDYNESKFYVTNSMFSGTTLNWDSANQILTVELPATIEEGGETHDTVLYKLNSDYCRFGTDITKLEYYGEITTPIKQYVQTLRTDVNTISGEVQSKVSTSDVTTAVTSGSTDAEIPSAKAVYDALGGGGGGKTIEAGRGISITTGETADTVSFNLPISAGTSDNSIRIGSGGSSDGVGSVSVGYRNTANGQGAFAQGGNTWVHSAYGHTEGQNTEAAGDRSHAEGYYTTAKTESSHAEGRFTKTSNRSEHAEGEYNVSVSASTTFGDSGNTLFSVGNGTSNSARHNAFEIRQNGDIYLTKDGQDVKLQDQLGGSSYTAGRGIYITNDTISFSLPISAGTGTNSIIENYTSNVASGSYSHAEGRGTTAGTGSYTHAEGYNTKASGSYSHAEGASSLASGSYTHAEGYNTKASGQYSHAEGSFTTAQNEAEHASGQYNVSSSASTTFGDSGNTLFSVGNGTNSARHNAFEIRQNGDIYFNDGTNDVKLQDKFTSIETTIGNIETLLSQI